MPLSFRSGSDHICVITLWKVAASNWNSIKLIFAPCTTADFLNRMDGLSGLGKWMGKVSDEWFSPPTSPTSLMSLKSPSVGHPAIYAASYGRDINEDLASSLSPLHSSREILAGYADTTCKTGNPKINQRGKSKSMDPYTRNRSYSTLPLAADEME